jgi:hypothetical protein
MGHGDLTFLDLPSRVHRTEQTRWRRILKSSSAAKSQLSRKQKSAKFKKLDFERELP